MCLCLYVLGLFSHSERISMIDSQLLLLFTFFSPLVQEKLVLEVEAMDKIRKAQGEVGLDHSMNILILILFN